MDMRVECNHTNTTSHVTMMLDTISCHKLQVRIRTGTAV